MRDQLPQQPNTTETGISNLDNITGSGTHWVAYAIDPRGIIYFDSYGLAPPIEFIKYIRHIPKRQCQSTLPTQTLTDFPICGQHVLNVLDAISKNANILPHKVVHEYTTFENTHNI